MEKELAGLVKELEQAAGPNLLSVLLYGSAATGEFEDKHSDLNLLCVFERLDADTLTAINPVTRRWARKGRAAPLVFAASQLAKAADVFAIELVDIKANHKTLYGSNLLASIEVPMTLHHLQVERELRQALIRLRQGFLASNGGRKAVLALMTASISSFAALFRHAAIALGAASLPGNAPAASAGQSALDQPSRKRESIDRLAALLGFDAQPFHAVLDVRQGKTKANEVDAVTLFRRYLEAITLVVGEVDRRLEARSSPL